MTCILLGSLLSEYYLYTVPPFYMQLNKFFTKIKRNVSFRLPAVSIRSHCAGLAHLSARRVAIKTSVSGGPFRYQHDSRVDVTWVMYFSLSYLTKKEHTYM